MITIPKKAETMSQYIIKVNGYEILNMATVSVVVMDTKSNEMISYKEFNGSSIKDLLPEIWNYIRTLKRKYPGIQVDSTGLPKQSSLNIFNNLVSLANNLDRNGFYDEASEIDKILFKL
jgi:hypothetical protein